MIDIDLRIPNILYVIIKLGILTEAMSGVNIFISLYKINGSINSAICLKTLLRLTLHFTSQFPKAFAKQKDVTGLVVHSDRWFQYTSLYYHCMLSKGWAQISMSRRGNCLDPTARIFAPYMHARLCTCFACLRSIAFSGESEPCCMFL